MMENREYYLIIMEIIVLVLPSVIGAIIFYFKVNKYKKIINKLEEEHTRYVGLVKKIELKSFSDYHENILYTIEINGKEYQCVQHTALYVTTPNRRYSNTYRLDLGQKPKITVEYGSIGTNVNVYFDGEKCITDIDETRKLYRNKKGLLYMFELIIAAGVVVLIQVSASLPKLMI